MSKDVPKTLDHLGVINTDGSRNHPCPADVDGRFTKARFWSRWALIAFFAVLPWIQIGDHPAVFIDIPRRSFFLFGFAFNAQDFFFFFFFLSGLGFALIVISALFGRLWCGWACPQTVFLEAVFRPIERWIDGPRNKQLRMRDAPWTTEKVLRRAAKHAFWIVMAFAITHIFLAYFISLERLWPMMLSSPTENWTAFLWMSVITGVLYFNFWWFREQLCIVICPYGRMQSALQDDNTYIIGYDELRGEPRGKKKAKKGDEGKALPVVGDCVDCNKCVTVCPTGIDIRNGLQLECIGCANCIDACDDVMSKLGRKPGLIRYDTRHGLDGERSEFVRPRLFYYLAAGLLGLTVATFWITTRHSFEANVLRVQGAPYVVENARVTNRYMLHLVNKGNEQRTFKVFFKAEDQELGSGFAVTIPIKEVTLEALASQQVPVVVEEPQLLYKKGQQVRLHVTANDRERVVFAPFLGPQQK